MDDKYVKVIYKTDPIGKYKIVLKLTTFDIEAFKKDQKLTEIPQKTVIREYVTHPGVIDRQTYMNYVENQVNNLVNEFYKSEIEKLKRQLEAYRMITIAKDITPPKEIIRGNVTNADKVVCDVIEGNVINCDRVECVQIKGNMINCN